jgi:type IV secretory pathway VirB2 component (pilin)
MKSFKTGLGVIVSSLMRAFGRFDWAWEVYLVFTYVAISLLSCSCGNRIESINLQFAEHEQKL